MANIKINDKVLLTEEAKKGMMFSENHEFTVKAILEEFVPYNIVLGAEYFGKDWECFVTSNEVELVE